MSTTVRGRHQYAATAECARCRRPGRSAYAFRVTTPDERKAWRDDGLVMIQARGLCNSCYRYATAHGTLADYERRNRDRGEILEDWHLLANPMAPVRTEVRRLAPQFGMTEDALEAALRRAGVRSRFDGGHGERFRAAA